MKYHKIIMAVLFSLCLGITACGTTESESETSSADSRQMVESGMAEASSDSAADEKASSEAEDSIKKDDSSFTEVVTDNDDITFEITGIDHENIWGYSWKVSVENHTDQDLTISMDNVSVNGVMCDPFWGVDVTAGNTANSTVSWLDSDFEDNDIEEVTEVDFTLNAFDSDNLETVYNEDFSVYPFGEEEAVNSSKEASDTDLILFDTDNCSMRITGVESDEDGELVLNATLENKSDETLMFSINDASIDGVMCDPFWADEVTAGKTSNERIVWYSSSLEDAGITDLSSIKTLTLPIQVSSSDDITKDPYVDETYTYNVVSNELE